MSQTSRDLQVDLQVLYRTTEQVVTYSLIRYTTRYPLEHSKPIGMVNQRIIAGKLIV